MNFLKDCDNPFGQCPLKHVLYEGLSSKLNLSAFDTGNFWSYTQAVTLPFFSGSSTSPMPPIIPTPGKYFYYASYSLKPKLLFEHHGVQLNIVNSS